ncbi:MAG: 4Fe-4S dicluster domain-containing protein [Thermodesulfobacteriota bacterium]|nr:4Fe-4S dicluster domain-containing protein [Thermodesulfobacteriota bacterium]
MPTVLEREELKTKKVLNVILDTKEPPVARCRLLSKGVEPYHRLYLETDNIVGDKACLACGNCVDSCPILRKDPERLQKTGQRTSFALESIVGEDCEQCYSCVLACPQVDTNIKDYIVDEKVIDVIPPSKKVTALDNYFMVIAALVFGIVIGAFLAW